MHRDNWVSGVKEYFFSAKNVVYIKWRPPYLMIAETSTLSLLLKVAFDTHL